MKNELGNNEIAGQSPQSSLGLTLEEMKVPELVVSDFFDRHTITNIRIYLQALLSNTQGSELPFFTIISRDIEKLLEATFIMNTKVIKEKSKEDRSSKVLTGVKVIDEDINFNIEYKFLHLIHDDPLNCLSKIFASRGNDSMKLELAVWKKIAVCGTTGEGRYYEASDRKRLFYFCDQLQHLIEAFFVLTEVGINKNIDLGELKNHTHFLFLTTKELHNPYVVIENFRNIFTLKYAKTELWYLLDTTIQFSDEKEIRKDSIILNYEMFLCTIKAAYLLDAKNESVAEGLRFLEDWMRE